MFEAFWGRAVPHSPADPSCSVWGSAGEASSAAVDARPMAPNPPLLPVGVGLRTWRRLDAKAKAVVVPPRPKESARPPRPGPVVDGPLLLALRPDPPAPGLSVLRSKHITRLLRSVGSVIDPARRSASAPAPQAMMDLASHSHQTCSQGLRSVVLHASLMSNAPEERLALRNVPSSFQRAASDAVRRRRTSAPFSAHLFFSLAHALATDACLCRPPFAIRAFRASPRFWEVRPRTPCSQVSQHIRISPHRFPYVARQRAAGAALPASSVGFARFERQTGSWQCRALAARGV